MAIHKLQPAFRAWPIEQTLGESAFSNVEEFSYTIGTPSKTTHGGCSSTKAFIINNGHQSPLLMNYSSQSGGIQRAGKA